MQITAYRQAGVIQTTYDIVKAHGGEIKVETATREGTTFIIQLPVNKQLKEILR